MRRDVFFFAGGAVLTALAVRYADNPRLWDGTIYIGVAVMALSILDFLMRQAASHRNSKMFSIVGMIVCGVGFIGFAGVYLWPILRPTSVSVETAQVNQNPVQATAGPQPDIVISLYLACRRETIPTTSLPNKFLTILEITTAFGDGMVMEGTIPAGHQKLPWPPDTMAFRCELTNYGEKTVFDVELLLNLTVWEAVRDTKEPGRISKGVTKPAKNYIFKIAKIDSGADRSIVFYIFNQSPNFARVITNETATLQQLGTVDRKTVPVMYSKKSADIIWFVPFPPMK